MGKEERLLESIHTGELDKAEYTGSLSAEELDKKLADLAKDDETILATYPAANIWAAIEEKKKKAPKPQKKFIHQFSIRQWTMLAAAVFCVALILPINSINKNETILSSSGVRTKGSVGKNFNLYAQGENQILRLQDNAKVKEGDLIQISYRASGEMYGMILSVDGNGIITQHFPDSKSVSGKLLSGSEIFLDFSYQLDNAPLFEKFIFVTSPNLFSAEKWEKAVESVNNPSKIKNLKDKKYFDRGSTVTEITLIK